MPFGGVVESTRENHFWQAVLVRAFRDATPKSARAATAENLASVIFELLEGAIPGELLYRLRLYPTADLCVEVRR